MAAILREDPRYYRSTGAHFFGRFGHAVLFTLVDRSDSGRRTIAVSNLAGSTAAGFIGMAFYPPGFDDTTHAYQRGTVEIANFAAHNLAAEFAPQMAALARKLHFPGRADGSSMPVDAEKP